MIEDRGEIFLVLEVDSGYSGVLVFIVFYEKVKCECLVMDVF